MELTKIRGKTRGAFRLQRCTGTVAAGGFSGATHKKRIRVGTLRGRDKTSKRQQTLVHTNTTSHGLSLVKREVSGWMRCFSRDRAEARGQQPLTTLVCPSLNGLEANARQRSDRAHKSRRPSSSLRESPRAQLQNEHPSRCKYKYLPHPHTAMHVKGTGKQADHRTSTPGIMQAVRGSSDLPARAWGSASILPPAPQSAQSTLQRGHSRSRPVQNLPPKSAV